MNKTVSGVDYSTGYTPSERARADWQRLITTTLKAGGARRVERDNAGPVTYLHSSNGVMLFEIHDNIGVPVAAPQRTVRHARSGRLDQHEMSL